MPEDRELCATFYLTHPAVPETGGRLLDQLALAGVSDVRVDQAAPLDRRERAGSPDAVAGRWAGLQVAVRDQALDLFRAVGLVFAESVVAPFEPIGSRPDFWLRVLEPFRLACERLSPVAALVPDLVGPQLDTVVAEREQWLLDANPVPLVHEGFALLHLSSTWFPSLPDYLPGLPYRRLALPAGPLLIGVETGLTGIDAEDL